MKDKIFIGGQMVGAEGFNKDNFLKLEKEILEKSDYLPLHIAWMPPGLPYENYMEIALALLQRSEKAVFLDRWWDSKSARQQYLVAIQTMKKRDVWNELEFIDKYLNNPDRDKPDYVMVTTEGDPIKVKQAFLNFQDADDYWVCDVCKKPQQRDDTKQSILITNELEAVTCCETCCKNVMKDLEELLG